MDIVLKKKLAANSPADEDDVQAIKKALNHLGYYMPFEKTGITGIPDAALFDAVKEFQRDQGFLPTGEIKPEDETLAALRREVKKQKKGFYLWHTVGDRRVRPSHAEMEGTLRNWEESPIPGEEPKCRCWAVPVDDAEMEALFPDAIKPAISPFDFIGGGSAVKQAVRIAPYLKASRFRDVRWIRNTPKAQFQSKFKHAKDFGIKGNMNNKTLSQYRQALEDHVKSPDTRVIKGTYRKQIVKHYYNEKTGLNVMRNEKEGLISGWKLDEDQVANILDRGSL